MRNAPSSWKENISWIYANGSDMMFYTRRIGASPSYTPRGIDNVGSYAETKENVPIIGALKLTGTNKRGLTIGVIESVTARSSSKVTRNGVEDVEVVEPLTNYTVARVQRTGREYLAGRYGDFGKPCLGSALSGRFYGA